MNSRASLKSVEAGGLKGWEDAAIERISRESRLVVSRDKSLKRFCTMQLEKRIVNELL